VIGPAKDFMDAPESLDSIISLHTTKPDQPLARRKALNMALTSKRWLTGARQALNCYHTDGMFPAILNPNDPSILRRQNFACRSWLRDAAAILIRRSLRRVKSR